jgi:two-component system cell cycle response regulator
MTAMVLVVDDNERNLRLLEALLANEYFSVLTAMDGYQALKIAKDKKPDIILLDVMMPGMDGFETCAKLKSEPDLTHIPVVMVTALSDREDRVRGLEAGADDFLTKPIVEVQLIARVKSLVRLKLLLDELRLRGQTGSQLGLETSQLASIGVDLSTSRVLLVDDDVVQSRQVSEKLGAFYRVDVAQTPEDTMQKCTDNDYDLIMVSTQLLEADGLRICSQLRSHENTRGVPVLLMIEADDQPILVKGLEIGANDYIQMPIDPNELFARARTQLKRKKYQDALKSSLDESFSMAIIDKLTGLYNRNYLDQHLKNLIAKSVSEIRPLSCMILDMDHFKAVNDTYGHDVGDEVLRALAERIRNGVRGSDLPARAGGEEFVVLMPGTPLNMAAEVAERIRSMVEREPFKISHEAGQITKTVSIGVASLSGEADNINKLMKRADEALYRAKNAGRNRIEVAEEAF